MSEVAHVCTKKDFQFIGKSVAAVLYLSHLAEEYSCGENIAESAGLYNVANFNLCMARNVFHVCSEGISSFPFQVSEVVCPAQAATDAAVTIEYRYHERIVWCDGTDDAYDASPTYNAHFRLNTSITSCIDDEQVVSVPDTVVNDVCRDEFQKN